MANNFTLTVDTTPPAGVTLNINSGAAYATTRAVTANVATSDTPTTGYMMKLWGDVDTTVNASIQATEAASAWITYAASQAVTLSTVDASKQLNLKVRDAAGNPTTSAAIKTITLDTTAPVPNITVAASPTLVSDKASFDTSTVTWQSDTAVTAYEWEVVATTGSLRGSGTVIPSTGGSLAAVTNVVTTIKAADVLAASAGDGAKILKIFVQDAAGNWSV